MKIKFNFETGLNEIGRLVGKNKRWVVIDTGKDATELARKYKMRCVFYDGTYSHLDKIR